MENSNRERGCFVIIAGKGELHQTTDVTWLVQTQNCSQAYIEAYSTPYTRRPTVGDTFFIKTCWDCKSFAFSVRVPKMEKDGKISSRRHPQQETAFSRQQKLFNKPRSSTENSHLTLIKLLRHKVRFRKWISKDGIKRSADFCATRAFDWRLKSCKLMNLDWGCANRLPCFATHWSLSIWQGFELWFNDIFWGR